MSRLLGGMLLMAALGASAQDSGRVRPPGEFSCDRNHLTAFTGKVIGYHRSRMGLTIRVHTDENTTEKFSLSGSRAALEKEFQLDGGKFAETDWTKIELSATRTQPKVRITVWQCEKPRSLLFNWQTPKK